ARVNDARVLHGIGQAWRTPESQVRQAAGLAGIVARLDEAAADGTGHRSGSEREMCINLRQDAHATSDVASPRLFSDISARDCRNLSRPSLFPPRPLLLGLSGFWHHQWPR